MKLGEFERTPIDVREGIWYYPGRKKFGFTVWTTDKRECILFEVKTKELRKVLYRIAVEGGKMAKGKKRAKGKK